MTALSERQRAESAIIDAACALRAIEAKGIGALEAERDFVLRRRAVAQRLYDAVEVYEAIPLEIPSQPAQSNNSTDTSSEAGASLSNISGDARIVFDEIVLAGGLTVDQLEQLLNRPHQSVSARVNDLMRKRWVVDSGHRRPTRSGRKAIVWTQSETARRQR